jgi:heme exporter protein B
MLMTILFNISLVAPPMLVLLVLGVLGFSTVGTLLATMTVQTRARESLLPIVMMPVALPLLLIAVRGSNSILSSAAAETWLGWLQILVVLDVIFMVVCFLLFEYVVEE